MLKAILVDDEAHCLDTLSIQLNEYCPNVQVVEQCSSAANGVKAIKKHNPDLVFLDIDMPHMNGFEMLELLSDISFAVVFTTSYDQYAIKAIRFSALDYLLKPIDAGELVMAVKKVQEQKRLPISEQFQMMLSQLHRNDQTFTKVAIPTTFGFELVPANEIISCEADDNYTHMHLKNKIKVTACRTLKEIDEQLQVYTFFIRVHHSYLVNLNEVVKYVRGEGGYLVMSDGSTVNVSRSRKDALLKYF